MRGGPALIHGRPRGGEVEGTGNGSRRYVGPTGGGKESPAGPLLHRRTAVRRPGWF